MQFLILHGPTPRFGKRPTQAAFWRSDARIPRRLLWVHLRWIRGAFWPRLSSEAYWRKHNPLQALAYLSLKLVLFPTIWASGLAYLFYFAWREVPDAPQWLQGVALVHTAAAFAILAFVIAHIYLLTTGHSFREHVAPMLTGFDEVDLSPEEEAYLAKDQPAHLG